MASSPRCPRLLPLRRRLPRPRQRRPLRPRPRRRATPPRRRTRRPRCARETFKVVEAEASKERKGDTQVFDLVKPKPKTADVAPQADASSAPGPNVDLSNVADAYPGDNASSEQIAAWMAHEAEKRGLPPQLPIMASLVESGMKNLNFGDADSVGFFQMRVGIWDQGPTPASRTSPSCRSSGSSTQAEAVKTPRDRRRQADRRPQLVRRLDRRRRAPGRAVPRPLPAAARRGPGPALAAAPAAGPRPGRRGRRPSTSPTAPPLQRRSSRPARPRPSGGNAVDAGDGAAQQQEPRARRRRAEGHPRRRRGPAADHACSTSSRRSTRSSFR